MKEELREKLIIGLMPYLDPKHMSDAKMKIDVILHDYSVQKEETSLTVYQGDVNDQILMRFLMAKAARGLSERTIYYYSKSISMTLRKIGKPYNEITADDIRLYLAIRVQKDKVSKTAANNERRNLSAFYAWLQKEEILLKNPMAKVEAIKETKKKKQAFTLEEIEKMRYQLATTREEALFEVLLSTWARVSEVAQIRLDEIKGEKILVHGKGDKEREVFLNVKARLALERYLAERKDNNPYLFPKAKYAGKVEIMCTGPKARQNTWYQSPDLVSENEHTDKGTIESIIRRIGKKCGVQAHPHKFRRTGATMALRNGMPILTVSKILGHSSLGVTQIYLDISGEELEEAHKKFAN